MSVLADQVDRADPTFVANREAMLEQLRELDDLLRQAREGGGAEVRRAPPGPRQAPRPRAHRSAARPRLALPRALAAGGVGQRLHRRRQRRHRRRRGSGVECVVVANDPTVRGGTSNPYSLKKVVPGLRHRLRQPAADDPAGRVGRRRPPHAVRDLPPRRTQLPRPHEALRRRHPHHRPRVRQLHRRWRLRARAVRPRRDGPGAAPRSSSAGRRW